MELGTPSDPVAAVMDLLAAHEDRLRVLDAQVAGFTGAAAQVGELGALARLTEQRIAVLAERLDQVAASPTQAGGPAGELSYQPVTSRRWWRLAGRDRDNALEAVRGWVEQIYRPGYGQLAASLGPCWEQHTVCLYVLDILTELWSLLYLSDSRSAALLSMQAEFQARVLPALAEQMAAETSRCRHRGDQPYAPSAAHVRRTP